MHLDSNRTDARLKIDIQTDKVRDVIKSMVGPFSILDIQAVFHKVSEDEICRVLTDLKSCGLILLQDGKWQTTLLNGWMQNYESWLQKLHVIWQKDPVLNKLLIPDWDGYQKLVLANPSKVLQQSSILLALESNYLDRILNPIRQFLFSSNELKDTLTNQYLKDLEETSWMKKSEDNQQSLEERKNDGFKSWFGKICEFICGAWLEENSWKVNSLEALGGSFDIEATHPELGIFDIEIKYIGFDTRLTKQQAENNESVGILDIEEAANYSLFRTNEAGIQFCKKSINKVYALSPNESPVEKHKKMVMLVIESVAFGPFGFALEENKISLEAQNYWLNNKFQEFLKDKAPTLSCIPQIDRLVVLKSINFSLEQVQVFEKVSSK